MKIIMALFFLLWCGAISSAEESFDIWRGSYRISYEAVKLPQDERMGLMGMNYLVDLSPRLYAGIGVYGAVSGNRGGFFTGGFDAGVRQRLGGRLSLNAGLFVGGGGGGAAPQGDGLMLRPYAGLLYHINHYRFGLQYARIDFPHGNITSNHAAVSIEMSFDSLRVHRDRREGLTETAERASLTTGRETGFVREHFAVLFERYSPHGIVKNTDHITDTEAIELTGFEYGRSIGGNASLFMEAAGAAGGRADGYAEIFFGGGYAYPLFRDDGPGGRGSLLLTGRIAAGAAGGGRVDTGGGTMYKALLGVQYLPWKEAALGADMGYVDAVRGYFSAKSVQFRLSYAMESASFGAPAAQGGGLYAQDWRIRLSQQTYSTVNASMRRNQGDGSVSLFGIKIDIAVNDAFYVTGQALGAYNGNAGGYAAGLAGLGYKSRSISDTPFSVFVEVSAGAAGGGSVSVGGGSVIQPMAGIIYDIGKAVSVEVSIGRVMATNGPLDSTLLDIGLAYRFSTLCRRL